MGDEKATEYLLESVENLHISDENGQYNNTLSNILYEEETKVTDIKNLLQTRGDTIEYREKYEDNLYNAELILNFYLYLWNRTIGIQ